MRYVAFLLLLLTGCSSSSSLDLARSAYTLGCVDASIVVTNAAKLKIKDFDKLTEACREMAKGRIK